MPKRGNTPADMDGGVRSFVRVFLSGGCLDAEYSTVAEASRVLALIGDQFSIPKAQRVGGLKATTTWVDPEAENAVETIVTSVVDYAEIHGAQLIRRRDRPQQPTGAP